MTSDEIRETLRRAEASTLARMEAHRPIDYAEMNRIGPRQKAALTRAVRAGDLDKITLACRAAVRAWGKIGAWPDDWHRWQNALDDALGWNRHVELGDLT